MRRIESRSEIKNLTYVNKIIRKFEVENKMEIYSVYFELAGNNGLVPLLYKPHMINCHCAPFVRTKFINHRSYCCYSVLLRKTHSNVVW